MNTPQQGQWWLQTDKQDRSDAKFFRVFFCGKDSKNRLIFEDADGNTEVDHGCDWSGWHHEPACTGWDWMPEVKAGSEYPKWYVPRNPNEVCESFGKPIAYYRRDSKKSGETFYTDGESFKWGYWEEDLNGELVRCSQAEAEARVKKKLLPPDVVNDLAVSLRKETKAEVVESPDDWVTQDRVPYRYGTDERRWVSTLDGRVVDDWSGEFKAPTIPPQKHGYVSAGIQERLELRCRRKDLPVVEETLAVDQSKLGRSEEKKPLPCSYCSNPDFKGWHNGKCPYCGKAKKSQDPGEGYRFVSSDEVVLKTDERAYIYEDTEVTGLIWGEFHKAVWFENGKTASDLRRKLGARNVVFRRKAVNAATVTVKVYEVLYGDQVGENGDELTLAFCTSEKDVNRIREVWKYVSVVSTKTVEVML